MRWAGVAVNAAVFTSSIGIDARRETDIRTVIANDERSTRVSVEDRRGGGPVLTGIRIGGVVEGLEPIRRIIGGAAATDGAGFTGHETPWR